MTKKAPPKTPDPFSHPRHHKDAPTPLSEKNRQQSPPAPGLYLVSTPIGNLGDMSGRGWRILKECNHIVCEDTRIAGRLLTSQGIKGRLIPYHDHNARRIRPKILKLLQAGAAIALISDAGTPLISDPGLKLVRACQDNAIGVFPVPGPNAALAALVVSGLPL